MSNNKMTQRDYFNEIIELALDNGREDIADFAKNRIALLDKKSENKKPNKKQAENADLKDKIAEVITDKALTASEIVKALDVEVTPQRVTALLTQMKNAGEVVRTVDKKTARFQAVDTDAE